MCQYFTVIRHCGFGDYASTVNKVGVLLGPAYKFIVLNDYKYHNYHCKSLDFLSLFYKNPEILRIGEIKQEIFVEKCKRLTIIHNNNDDLLDIYYNNNLIKKLTPTRLSIENPDRISFIDRPLVNNFTNIETGKIFFSQPVFIHSIIRYI